MRTAYVFSGMNTFFKYYIARQYVTANGDITTTEATHWISPTITFTEYKACKKNNNNQQNYLLWKA
jgi:hypothetical protein